MEKAIVSVVGYKPTLHPAYFAALVIASPAAEMSRPAPSMVSQAVRAKRAVMIRIRVMGRSGWFREFELDLMGLRRKLKFGVSDRKCACRLCTVEDDGPFDNTAFESDRVA